MAVAEYKITRLIEAVERAGNNEAVREKVLDQCRTKVELLSSGGAKKGIRDQVDIHGRPYLPLKFPRPSGGALRLRDKGLLLASIGATMERDTVTLSANSPGARIQNEGGTIRPKSAKSLAIPKSREAQRIGTPRRFPRKLFYLAARNASGNSSGVLAEKKGDGPLVVHYVLVKQVTIPQTQYLGWSANTLDAIMNLLADNYAAEMVKLFEKGEI